MLNKIINSPYALGLLLSGISLVSASFHGPIGIALKLGIPLLIAAVYTYSLNKQAFKFLFTARAALVSVMAHLGVNEIIQSNLATTFSGLDTCFNRVFFIIIIMLFILYWAAISYFLIFVGNKLGLWILKKTK